MVESDNQSPFIDEDDLQTAKIKASMILRRCSSHFIYWTTVNQSASPVTGHYITSSWCNDYCDSGGWVCLDPRSSWSGIQPRLGLSPSTDCLQCMVLKTVHAEVASFPGPAQLSVAYSMETIFLYCKQEKAAWVGPGTRLCWSWLGLSWGSSQWVFS